MKESKNTVQPKKRISKRVYPERICPQTGKVFIPTDARQKYLNPQERINYNNDQRRLKDIDLKDFNARLLQNKRGLARIYQSLVRQGQVYCSYDLLLYENVDLKVFRYQTKDEKTDKNILWSLNYGVEYEPTRNLYKVVISK